MSWGEAIAVIVTIGSGLVGFLALCWSAVQYVRVRKEEIRQMRFENVQRLVKTFAGFDNPSLASQFAAAFEFRFYPEYLELLETLRAKHGFGGPHGPDILAELDKSLEFLRTRNVDPWKGRLR